MAGRYEPNPNLASDIRHRILAPAVERKAEAVLQRAIVTAPIDTGRYKNSLYKTRTATGWRIVAPVHYAIYLEFGTRRMRAYRTLGRALDAAREG